MGERSEWPLLDKKDIWEWRADAEALRERAQKAENELQVAGDNVAALSGQTEALREALRELAERSAKLARAVTTENDDPEELANAVFSYLMGVEYRAALSASEGHQGGKGK